MIIAYHAHKHTLILLFRYSKNSGLQTQLNFTGKPVFEGIGGGRPTWK
jgi:hypothetical protein